MSKNILILFCVYFSLSCSFLDRSKDYRKPSAEDSAKHYVFLIHGLAGKKSTRLKMTQETQYDGTFGFMKTAIKEDIERMNNGSREVLVEEAVYGTGSDTKTPYDFALQFGDIVKKLLRKTSHRSGQMTSKDMLSIVVHSQGGLVAAIWYTYSRVAYEQQKYMQENPNLSFAQAHRIGFLDEERFRKWIQFKRIYPRVNNLVTLGSPFWGAKSAYAGHLTNQKKLRHTIKEKVGFKKEIMALAGEYIWGVASFFDWIKMGNRELEEMSFGSNSIYKFRRRAIWTHKNLGGLPINVINMAGVALRATDIDKSAWYNFGNKTKKYLKQMEGNLSNEYSGGGFGGQYFESDTMVMVPSARFDFIYADFANKKNITKIKFDDFTHTHFKSKKNKIPFLVTHSIHASSKIETLYDIVATPYKCEPEFRDMISTLSRDKNKYMRKVLVNARLLDPNFLKSEKLSQAVFQTFKVQKDGKIKLAGKWHSDITDQVKRYAQMLAYYQDIDIKVNKENMTCDHPTYHNIVSNVLDCKLTDCDPQAMGEFYNDGFQESYDKYQRTRSDKTPLVESMRGFFVDINLQLPKDYDLNLLGNEFQMHKTLFKDLLKFPVNQGRFEDTGELIYGENSNANKNARIFVNRKSELLSHRAVIQTIDDYEGEKRRHLRIYFTGVVYPKSGRRGYREEYLEAAKDGFPMKFNVTLPGLKSLEVEAKVSPMYSTFFDVKMQKIDK